MQRNDRRILMTRMFVGALGIVVLVAAGFLAISLAGHSESPAAVEKAAALPVSAGPTTYLPGKSFAAIKQAADAKKYLFLFFYKADDEETQTAKRSFDELAKKFADRADAASVNVTDPAEQGIVNQYGLGRAPMPLVLAMAPNGAVTRSFVKNFDETQFALAFVSAGTEKVVKALQSRKMAFVCVQNGSTQRNAEAVEGVKAFVADAQYAKTTEVVMVDPADAAEQNFLTQLKVDPRTAEAVTVFLAPPGTMVGVYKGETKKEALVAAAKAAAQGCNPQSGCCPAPPKKS
jgi:hypothetical protein